MKILLLHSPSTKGGTERIRDFLEPEISVDFAAHRPGSMAAYDGVILHNRVDAKPGEPTAIYPCGRPTGRMLHQEGFLDQVLAGKPRAIWTNSETATYQLSSMSLGVGAGFLGGLVRIRYMPKPFVLTIPDVCPPLPSDKRILWYWRKNWPYTENIDDQIRELVREVADSGVEVWIISNKGKPEEHELLLHPKVRPMGRIVIPERIHEISGMVRVSEGLDYGRITYQIMAYGRWCIYVGMKEPEVISTDDLRAIPTLVKNFMFNRDTWLAEDRRKYVADNFSEEALSRKWVKEAKEVFG